MIVLAVFFAIVIIGTSLLETTNNVELYWRTLGILFFLIIFTLVIYPIFVDRGYKQGQIDALTNDVQYKLITLPDSTKVWEKIGEEVK